MAWEAAQQLSAAGKEVALLVLIQSMNPEFARFKPGTSLLRQWWYRAAKRVDLERDNLANRGLDYFGERCRDVTDILRAKAAIAFDTIFGNRKRPEQMPMRYILESLRIEHAKAYSRYNLRPYQGHVLLLRASKQLAGLMMDHTSGWKEAVGGHLEVCQVPGHQQSMLSEPYIARLAVELSIRLNASPQHSEAKLREAKHSPRTRPLPRAST